MGVPALFRWLSKKYPKIVARVVEDTPVKVRNEDGEVVEVPVQYAAKNPNGFEVDNLYLDMNGIVHPCTHPEGKPAPETEEDMMVEIFNYTERVVNMARPRKVLMMAIDGVAPRAKMNQQRSRRFRAAQEAADKEEERREAIKLFEAMGHPVSDETRNHKSWDSNAITPGTPFMDLLSRSLKYWVSHKMTTDPGWKDLKVIISDSSVPGEGEHKIMDWVRRQRSYPEWDPNTSHVIYGLDADLIMLSLATHEPNFRVLREDVFAQGSKGPTKCKNCGEEGHYAANCKGDKKPFDLTPKPKVVETAKPVDPKPFIFLDVSCLREYLAVELNVPHQPFPFDLELAIDDWIFMIFFVGNDFLPHLPSLEIREGAIDVLLRIWRAELGRMGGYLTNHGKVDLYRAQVILEGLAKSEDEIFQKRKEDEERQESRQKRQRIDDHRRQDEAKAAKENGNRTVLNGQEYVAVEPAMTARGGPLHPSLPTRPNFDLVPKEEASATGKPKKLSAAERAEKEAESLKQGLAAMQGSNSDLVKNRRAIRMANMSAAQMLKAELNGEDVTEAPVGEASGEDLVTLERHDEDEKEQLEPDEARALLEKQAEDDGVDEEVIEPAVQTDEDEGEAAVPLEGEQSMEDEEEEEQEDLTTVEGEEGMTREERRAAKKARKRGKKRKADDDHDDEMAEGDDDDDEEDEAPPNPEADQPIPKKKLKFNSDGTVEGYEDDVKLWEPGYRERYYEKKFGVPLSDRAVIDEVVRCYMEGLCWVLEYYYQGVPAWDWYYPYHYAPFAQDFANIDKLKIEFEPAEPFKPFAQLLGVFPAASRIHLPPPLQTLMIDEDSPILDFYPSDFEIDMNGKKMAWQGIALLPFIDQHRLLSALKSKEKELTDDEKRRNRWGDNVMFVSEGNRLYESFCGLYTLKAGSKPVPLDVKLSLGTSGSVLADPQCVPNSGYDSPLPNIEACPDLTTNNSISVRYYFPRQAHPHKSIILRGYRPLASALTESDRDWVRRGGGGRDRRSGPGGGGGPGGGRGYGGPGMSNGYGGGGGGSRSHSGTPSLPPRPNQADLARYNNGSSYQPNPSGYGGHRGPPPVAAYNGNGAYNGGGGGSYGSYGSGSGGSRQPPLNAYAPPYQPKYNPYGAPPPNPYGAPSAAYGGYAPPPPPPRNPYAAPPPNPYARNAPPPPGGGGYGGYGGGGAGGGYGRRY